jgi:hypothetical protein
MLDFAEQLARARLAAEMSNHSNCSTPSDIEHQLKAFAEEANVEITFEDLSSLRAQCAKVRYDYDVHEYKSHENVVKSQGRAPLKCAMKVVEFGKGCT